MRLASAYQSVCGAEAAFTAIGINPGLPHCTVDYIWYTPQVRCRRPSGSVSAVREACPHPVELARHTCIRPWSRAECRFAANLGDHCLCHGTWALGLGGRSASRPARQKSYNKTGFETGFPCQAQADGCRLQARRVLQPPDTSVLQHGTPSAALPSDHIPLVAEFVLQPSA
jgi:hypothetical protein